MDGLKWKILLQWMIWRYPHFKKPPYVFIEAWPGEASYRKSRFLLQKWLSCNSFLKSVARELVLAIYGLAPSISHNFCRPGTQEDSIPQALSAKLWFAAGASFTAFAYGSDS